MLVRHVLGYIPSQVVPALVSFVTVFAYTHMFSTEAFGHYALALNIMTLINAVFFYGLQSALPRLIPEMQRKDQLKALQSTTYMLFAALALLMAILMMAISPFVRSEVFSSVLVYAALLAVVRSLLSVNQSFHRAAFHLRRYNILECGQALLGFGMGFLLVVFTELAYRGALAGMVVGITLLLLWDAHRVVRMHWNEFKREHVHEILRFGLPMTVTFALVTLISTSDRFIIEHYRGITEVGIYAAGFNLMDRVMSVLFMMIAMPLMPLSMRALEHEGPVAARAQTRQGGILMLAVCAPACAGLALVSPHLAHLFIGPDFREGAMQVMPWIAVSAFFFAVTTHYFDHAFYLSKRPGMYFYTKGPVALLNLAANFYLIPKYGYVGAAYAAVFSYGVLLVWTIVLTQWIFPLFPPLLPLIGIALSVLFMAVSLSVISVPLSVLGLAIKVVAGVLVYGAAILLFNVADARGKLKKLLGQISS